jgi:hypothetical protein
VSMIIHRCTTCQHPDQFHASTELDNTMGCSHGWCDTPRHVLGPPEVIPTWGPDSQPQENVIPPGTRLQGYPHTTCDCTPCRELYDSLAFAA